MKAWRRVGEKGWSRVRVEEGGGGWRRVKRVRMKGWSRGLGLRVRVKGQG